MGAEDAVAAVADVDVVDVVVDVEVSFWKFLRKNFSAKNSLKCLRVLARPRIGEWLKQFSEAFYSSKGLDTKLNLNVCCNLASFFVFSADKAKK